MDYRSGPRRCLRLPRLSLAGVAPLEVSVRARRPPAPPVPALQCSAADLASLGPSSGEALGPRPDSSSEQLVRPRPDGLWLCHTDPVTGTADDSRSSPWQPAAPCRTEQRRGIRHHPRPACASFGLCSSPPRLARQLTVWQTTRRPRRRAMRPRGGGNGPRHGGVNCRAITPSSAWYDGLLHRRSLGAGRGRDQQRCW